jgi:hypothetical protein
MDLFHTECKCEKSNILYQIEEKSESQSSNYSEIDSLNKTSNGIQKLFYMFPIKIYFGIIKQKNRNQIF